MTSIPARLLWVLLLATLPFRSGAQVVINEILYHAPDELDDLQYVELHNVGSEAVDLSGWSFTQGIQFQFPAGTRIASRGFVVVCRNTKRFAEFYPVPVAGEFQSQLRRKGERLELSNAAGKPVDSVKFSDRAPWPTGADGHSGSLERICPTAPGDDPSNWISSPLTETREKPGGTPGQPNAGYSESLPPVLLGVTFSPDLPTPGQSIAVEATLRPDDAVKSVDLLYRLAGPGFEKPEERIPMKLASPGHYQTVIPGQNSGALIRFRVQAAGPRGGVRNFPAESEPRPALSAFVPEKVDPAKIPFTWILQTTEKEMKAAESRSDMPAFGAFGQPSPRDIARFQTQRQLDENLNLSELWRVLTTEIAGEDPAIVAKLKPIFLAKVKELRTLRESLLAADDIEDQAAALPKTIQGFWNDLAQAANPSLSPNQQKALQDWLEHSANDQPMPQRMIRRRVDLDTVWHALTLNADVDPQRWPEQRKALRDLDARRQAVIAALPTAGPREAQFRELRKQVDDLRAAVIPTFEPLASKAQLEQLERWKTLPREFIVGIFDAPPELLPAPGGPGGPGAPRGFGGPAGPAFGRRGGFGGPRGPGGPFGAAPSEPGSFRSALVYFDPATSKTSLFDFVQVTGRKGGQKVHLHRDQPLNGMTTVALIFENDLGTLVEPLAYEVYRRAGMPVEQCYHVRLWQNGKPSGYTQFLEQPNKAFLRRNGIEDDGTMYKLLWFGDGLVGQHEKHTHRREGHADLAAVVDGLEKNSGNAQWDFIRTHFDVDEVATYFAVNMVLSHWDGFFNNYFTYHSPGKSGKWMMFPWDQDSTWGLRAFTDDEVFTTMALTFGMNGDQAPPDGGGSWRPPGWFSGPLLANPQFRQVFLRRTKTILESVYTEAVFGPILDRYAADLEPEVRLRASLHKEDPGEAVATFKSNLAKCRLHLRKRREFLLAQPEMKRVQADPPAGSPPRSP